mgnify:FL=1
MISVCIKSVKGSFKIRFNIILKLLSIIGWSLVMSAPYAYADIVAGVDFGSNQNNQFMVALCIFFVLTISVIFWLLRQRQVTLKKLKIAADNAEFLKKIISQKQDSFFLWNENKELLLNSEIDIRFEDETIPENLDDLKSRFSLSHTLFIISKKSD